LAYAIDYTTVYTANDYLPLDYTVYDAWETSVQWCHRMRGVISQRWQESHFQTPTPLLIQKFESGSGNFQIWESDSCSNSGKPSMQPKFSNACSYK